MEDIKRLQVVQSTPFLEGCEDEDDGLEGIVDCQARAEGDNDHGGREFTIPMFPRAEIGGVATMASELRWSDATGFDCLDGTAKEQIEVGRIADGSGRR